MMITEPRPKPHHEPHHEPTLADLLKDIWCARLFLLGGGFLGLLLAFAWTEMAVPHYRATMMVGPAERAGGPDIKALLPDNSSFAVQYLMSSIGTKDSSDFMRFEQTVRQPSVAARLLKDKRIREALTQDRSLKFQTAAPIDSAVKLAGYLQHKVAIEPVAATPMRRLVYTHPDGAFAAYLLRRMHAEADGIIQEEIRQTAEKRAVYLQKALEKTKHPDHRRALTSLLMEQEHVRMILAMDEPFAATITEPPSAGATPDWPNKKIAFPVAILVGMLLAYAAHVLRRA